MNRLTGITIITGLILVGLMFGSLTVEAEEYPFFGTLHDATAGLVIDATEWQGMRADWIASFNVDPSGFFDDVFRALSDSNLPNATNPVTLTQGEYGRMVSIDKSDSSSLTLRSYYTTFKSSLGKGRPDHNGTGNELAWIISDATSYATGGKRSRLIGAGQQMYSEKVNGKEVLLP